MIKIQHRVNSLKKLKNINEDFGVEIDVRSIKKKLILNHEPFKKNYSLCELRERDLSKLKD